MSPLPDIFSKMELHNICPRVGKKMESIENYFANLPKNKVIQ